MRNKVMDKTTKEYKFVLEWLSCSTKHKWTRRTWGKNWGKKRCADVADILEAYTADLQATVERQTEYITKFNQRIAKNAHVMALEEKHEKELEIKNLFIKGLGERYKNELKSQQLRIKDLQRKYESQYAKTEEREDTNRNRANHIQELEFNNKKQANRIAELKAELRKTVPVEEHNRLKLIWKDHDATLCNRIKELKEELYNTVPTAYHDDLMDKRWKLELAGHTKAMELDIQVKEMQARINEQVDRLNVKDDKIQELRAIVERQAKRTAELVADSNQTIPQYDWVEPTKSKNAHVMALELRHEGLLKIKNTHIRKLQQKYADQCEKTVARECAIRELTTRLLELETELKRVRND